MSTDPKLIYELVKAKQLIRALTDKQLQQCTLGRMVYLTGTFRQNFASTVAAMPETPRCGLPINGQILNAIRRFHEIKTVEFVFFDDQAPEDERYALRAMRPTGLNGTDPCGVVEMKTPDVRMHGWFPFRGTLILHSVDLKDKIVASNLDNGYRDQVIHYRDKVLGLTDYCSGDSFHDFL